MVWSGRRMTSTPIEISRSHIVSTSAMRGTLRNTCSPSASSVAAISLRAEFLAPPTATEPDNGARLARRSGPPRQYGPVSRITTQATVPRPARVILTPKDGVVLERRVGAGDFEAAGGPFDWYRRVVTVDDAGDGPEEAHIAQVVEFRLAPAPVRLDPRPAVPGPPAAARGAHRPAVVGTHRPDRSARGPEPGCPRRGGGRARLPRLPSCPRRSASRHNSSTPTRRPGVALAPTRADIVIVLVLVAFADRRAGDALLISTGGAAVLTAAGPWPRHCPGWPPARWPPADSRRPPSPHRHHGGRDDAAELARLLAQSADGVGLDRRRCLARAPVRRRSGAGRLAVLYAIGLVGLPMVMVIGRRLPETTRFEARHPDTPHRATGRRLWLGSFGPAAQPVHWRLRPEFLNDFLRHERHYSAEQHLAVHRHHRASPAASG